MTGDDASGGGSLIPVSDEQAKLLRDGLGYTKEVLGDLPKDLVGVLVGDPVKAVRRVMLDRLWNRTKKISEDRGVEPETPRPKIAYPIVAAAADETNEELQEIWARLLAAAMDPARAGNVRQSLIDVVKLLEPLDARIFRHLAEEQVRGYNSDLHGQIERAMNVRPTQVELSLAHLVKLELLHVTVTQPGVHPPSSGYLTPLGKELWIASKD